VSDGDILEFPEVYAAYHAKVLAYAAKLIGPDEAEDIAQEVFVKISRSLGTLADPAKLTSWICAITLNTVRDAARRRSSRPDRPPAAPGPTREDRGEEVQPTSIADTASRTPEEAAMHREMIACYLDYVDQLPALYREVYVLRELGDLSNEEIAGRLSLPLGTVKMRLHRARAMLNERLRRNCQCYCTERGELMGEPKDRQPG
jgi:RNA polymerase sigma-70 factor (ECF subfamily)